MSAYGALARYYDALTTDVPYEKWANRVETLFEKFGQRPSILLELACGTGNLTKIFADRGYEVIASDSSTEMLSVAAVKVASCNKRPLLINQSMEDINLYGTVNGVICGLDSINYLTSFDLLKKAFSRVSLFLERGGLFVFDVNTEKKLKDLNGQVFTRETSDIFCVWQAQWAEKERICSFFIDIFNQKGELYARFTEEHTERAFSLQELALALKASSMTLKVAYSGLSNRRASDYDDRILIVAEKL